MKVYIVGGVAGGASTAARLRRLSETAEIVLLERGSEISYANCGIPYHIGSVISEREKLVVVTAEYFRKTLNVDVRINAEAIAIDPAQKTITIKDLRKGTSSTEKYDALVLSPGGAPMRPPIPGIQDDRIFTIRNLEDMDKVIGHMRNKTPKRAVVVGAGFIGLEMAENLAHLGLQVSIVELAGQVMNLLDYEMATIIHQHLKVKNVGVFLNDGVKEFKSGANVDLILQSGRTLSADLVILSIGVKPEIKLAKDAGLTIGQLGGIAVNEHMQTSNASIYALGDATEVIDSVCNCPALIPLANAANKQGRIVADNIIEPGKRSYNGTPGTAIAKVFDLTVAMTGSSEKSLKKKGIAYDAVYLQPSSHAGYYPNAMPMFMKVIYEKGSGRVLGAQIVGSAGVDKRIDVIASAVQNRQTVHTLAELELAYAPPFSSAKDPVNLAGMIAINQLEGRNPVIYWQEVKKYKDAGALFIDVRTALEFQLGHLEGSINIPLADLRARYAEIPKDAPVVFYCNQGKQTYFALSFLRNIGYTQVYSLSGGYKLYHMTTLPQENTDVFEKTFIDKRDDVHSMPQNGSKEIQIDACGLQCPGPIMRISKELPGLHDGDILAIKATDPGFMNDISAWCETTGNTLLEKKADGGFYSAKIQKGGPKPQALAGEIPHDKTIVVFSGDLDKVIASFIIANGALAMGRKVTMFFTFWGLNALRKTGHVKVKKSFIETMFGIMMPRGTKKLGLSRMNMLGFGAPMIRYVMKSKNVESLEGLIQAAMQSGITIIACQMSMDVMGIKQEELIDGVSIGGVANYLNAAEKSDTNLFI